MDNYDYVTGLDGGHLVVDREKDELKAEVARLREELAVARATLQQVRQQVERLDRPYRLPY